MGKWKKSFRELPPSLVQELDSIDSVNVKVLAGKILTAEQVAEGLYEHVGLTVEKLAVGEKWETLPSPNVGIRSKRNLDGWEITRKDLPKITKYYYRDIPIYGDTSNWTTAAIPRDVYEKDEYPPYLFQIEVRVQEQKADGSFGIVFALDEVFLKSSISFEDDLLFAINLLQENTGVSGVTAAENPDFVFTSDLNWELFPPEDIDAVFAALTTGRAANSKDDVKDRLHLFEQFRPVQYLKGLGGNDHYIGAKYADDLVVFENVKYGNALYVLYNDWEELSQRSRSDLLKLKTSQYDRIIHTEGWENRFALLMQTELKKRGIRIGIGRHMRRHPRGT